MADLTVKQHDNWPPVEALLSDQNGAVNLSSATSVKFIMKGSTTLISGTCAIDPDQNLNRGKVTYTWQTGNTNTIGVFQVEWEVTWSNGKKETFPNNGYRTIEIVADLDGA